MRNRINAMRMTFNLMLSCIELLIGARFLMKIFDSDDTTNWLMEDAGILTSQASNGITTVIQSNDLNGSVAFLLMVLGFMFVSLFLFAIFPKMTEKVEKNIEFDFE